MPLRCLASVLLALVAIVWITPTGVARACVKEAAAKQACCCGKADAVRGEGPQVRRARCCEAACGGVPPDVSMMPASLPSLDDTSTEAEPGAPADRLPRVGARVMPRDRGQPPSLGPPPWLRHRRLLI